MLVAVASAKGSPGVSALAVALAALWPVEGDGLAGAVALADVDPVGGDLALRYRAPSGEPLDEDRGLLSLGASVRRGAETSGAGGGLADHLQPVAGGLDVLVGVSGPEQVQGLGPVWGTLATALRPADRDVVADCGRVVPGTAHLPVLAAADALVLVVRPDVAGVAHLRERLGGLTPALRLDEAGGTPVGVVVRAPERDRRAADDVAALLASAGSRARVLGVVADDPKGVAALEQQRPGAGRSAFVRSVRSLVPAVVGLAARAPAPA